MNTRETQLRVSCLGCIRVYNDKFGSIWGGVQGKPQNLGDGTGLAARYANEGGRETQFQVRVAPGRRVGPGRRGGSRTAPSDEWQNGHVCSVFMPHPPSTQSIGDFCGRNHACSL